MVAGIVWGRVRRESITTSLAGPAIYRSGAACLLLRDGNDNAHAYPLDPINRNDTTGATDMSPATGWMNDVRHTW